MTATWRIGALARDSGLTVRALHHYDSIGLVTPSMRTAGGHRIYGEADVERLYAVLVLRRLGMSTAAIAAALLDPALDLESVARQQRADLDAELAALAALRGRLEALLSTTHDIAPIDCIAAMRQLSATPLTVRHALALLPYDDLLDAQARLVTMFGFAAGAVTRDADGVVVHASVLAGQGYVHLHPPTAYLAPPGPDGRGSAIVVAAVADVDRHCAVAVGHGATVVYGPSDMAYGVREYGARDHAGHHWSFQSPLQQSSVREAHS